MQQDYYQILGVSKDATQDQIKRAYRKKAQTYHPDVNKTEEAESMMKKINEAYDVLGDMDKKAHYDRVGSSHYQNQQYQGYRPNQGQYRSQEEMFEELFRQFYRQAHAQQGNNTQYRQYQHTFNPIGFFFRIIFGMYIFNAILNFIYLLFFQ